MDFDEKKVIERIRQLRINSFGQRGKSKFAQQIGLSPSTYNYYENDRLAPISVLLKIAQATGVSLNWLITGQNEGRIDTGTENPAIQRVAKLLKDSPKSIPALLAFLDLLDQNDKIQKKLTPTQKISEDKKNLIPVLGRTAAGMIHFWDQTDFSQPTQAASKLEQIVPKYITEDTTSDNRLLSVDSEGNLFSEELKNIKVHLVQINEFDPTGISEFIQSTEISQLLSDCFALRVDGDSMAPRINDNDIVILSPSVPAEPGKPAVAKLKDQIGVTCKLLRATQDRVHLIPINEKYDIKIVQQEDVLWAFTVLCHIKVKNSGW